MVDDAAAASVYRITLFITLREERAETRKRSEVVARSAEDEKGAGDKCAFSFGVSISARESLPARIPRRRLLLQCGDVGILIENVTRDTSRDDITQHFAPRSLALTLLTR